MSKLSVKMPGNNRKREKDLSKGESEKLQNRSRSRSKSTVANVNKNEEICSPESKCRRQAVKGDSKLSNNRVKGNDANDNAVISNGKRVLRNNAMKAAKVMGAVVHKVQKGSTKPKARSGYVKKGLNISQLPISDSSGEKTGFDGIGVMVEADEEELDYEYESKSSETNEVLQQSRENDHNESDDSEEILGHAKTANDLNEEELLNNPRVMAILEKWLIEN